MIWTDIRAPGPIPFLKSQSFNRAVPGIAQTVLGASVLQCVIDRQGIFGGQVEFPAKLSNISEPQSQNRAPGDADLQRSGKRLSLI